MCFLIRQILADTIGNGNRALFQFDDSECNPVHIDNEIWFLHIFQNKLVEARVYLFDDSDLEDDQDGDKEVYAKHRPDEILDMILTGNNFDAISDLFEVSQEEGEKLFSKVEVTNGPCSSDEFIDEVLENTNDDETNWDVFLQALWKAENSYLSLLSRFLHPEQARDVLPNATKTELIMTGFASDWKFLMDLRLFEKTGKVHPDMKDLMQKAQKVMQEAGIWEDIMSKPSKFD